MNLSYREYISIGINHHLLCKKIAVSAKSHMESLLPLLEDTRFDVFDLWIVEEEPYKKQEINAIRACGRTIVYNIGDREGNPISYPTARDRRVRSYALDCFKWEISRGIEAGAKKIVTSSGPQHPDDYQEAFMALVDFYSELCEFVPDDVMILIEPTDKNFDKCFFIGSSEESIRLAEMIHKRGINNFASMIDMCHLPLMDETIEQAVNDLGNYLKHIHLGTCVNKEKSNPFYGDKHPAWGMKGTVWGENEIAELIYLCLQTGYFGKENRGTATFEMEAYKDIPYLKSIDRFFYYIEKAWEQVKNKSGIKLS